MCTHNMRRFHLKEFLPRSLEGLIIFEIPKKKWKKKQIINTNVFRTI